MHRFFQANDTFRGRIRAELIHTEIKAVSPVLYKGVDIHNKGVEIAEIQRRN